MRCEGQTLGVGTVYAIGRNYAEHAHEMGELAEPVVFSKPATSVTGGGDIPWPPGVEIIHHEVELVYLLGRDCFRAGADTARDALQAVAIGVDLTARDVQARAKSAGRPWLESKGFAGSAPVSRFVPLAGLPCEQQLDLRLLVDGETRQHGHSGQMILPPLELVMWLSERFALRRGDLIFTGTPAGVGPIEPGQQVSAQSAALAQSVTFHMARRT